MHKVAFPHCYLLCIGNCGSRFSNRTTSIFLTRLLYADLATLCKYAHSQLFTFQPLLFSLAALELYVKITNSPFCAPQLILFQKRKHRVERLNTISTTNNKIQNGIRNLPQFLSSSVPQFFSDPSLLSLFRSLLYIYLYIYNNI